MKEDIQNELREISPLLAGLEKKDPFKAPKYYFESLTDKVLEKAQPQAIPPQYATHSGLFERLSSALRALVRPRIAIGMATLALLAVSSWWFLKTNDKTTTLAQNEITHEEIQQYIQENISDFDDELLLGDGKIALDTEGGALQKAEMTDEEIEEYLKENFTDKDLEILEN